MIYLYKTPRRKYIMSKDRQLEELNEQCRKYQDEKRKNFEPINGKNCESCPIGQLVKKCDREEWRKIDWNSGRWEKYYRH